MYLQEFWVITHWRIRGGQRKSIEPRILQDSMIYHNKKKTI